MAKQKIQTFTESLPVKLTDAERIERSQQMAGILAEINTLELQKKAQTSSISERIKAKKVDLSDVALQVRTGEEIRAVECFEKKRYEDKIVEIIRTDTNEVVRSRKMQPNEQQEKLDFLGTPKKEPTQRRKKGESAPKASTKGGRKPRLSERAEAQASAEQSAVTN